MPEGKCELMESNLSLMMLSEKFKSKEFKRDVRNSTLKCVHQVIRKLSKGFY